MRKRTGQVYVVCVQFAPASAPTLQDVQRGEAAGALARLLVAYHRSQQKMTPKQQMIGVKAVQAS